MTMQAYDLQGIVHHLTDCVNAGDLDAIMTLFTEDAVLVRIPPLPHHAGIAIGRRAIRAWLAQHIPKLYETCRNIRTYGPIVTWDVTISGDRFRQVEIDSFELRAEASISDGKIALLTIILPLEAISTFQTAMTKAGAS